MARGPYHSFYESITVRSNANLLVAFGLLTGLTALFTLALSLFGWAVPWPTTAFQYGYVLHAINWVIWIPCLATASFNNHPLTTTTLVATGLNALVNIVILAYMLAGVIQDPTVLVPPENALFGLLISIVLAIFGLAILFFTWGIWSEVQQRHKREKRV